MLDITFDKKTQKYLKDVMAHYRERVERGEELFLLELATVLRREILAAGMKVARGGKRGKPYSYAKKLRIGLLKHAADADASVALWVEEDHQQLKADQLMKTALLIKPKDDAPAHVHAIAAWGWIPADMLPFPIEPTEAEVIARRVRLDEAQALRDRMLGQRKAAEQDLKEAGAPVTTIASGQHGLGLRVYVDLAWEVLRGEFGYGDRRQEAHWRPAIQVMMAHVEASMGHFLAYLMSGNEHWFDVDESDAVSWAKVRTGIGFQKELMPFVKQAVK